ncbi:MAG: DUF4369 domain-containing protein [Chitinophagaceae bacterium]|nr:DUF4369 domain-containing protein [Chitinophagaceae bacterium]
MTNKVLCQNEFILKGYLKGLGTGKKVYLGNKPKGIGPTFIPIFFDSVYSVKDSFYFKKHKFNYVTDYSVETELDNGWQSFLIDKGNILISGHADTIYRSKVIGSANETLYKKFTKEIYKPWDSEYFAMMKRLPGRKDIDSSAYKKINDSMIALTLAHRNRIYNFYKENVKQRPYVALEPYVWLQSK